jgi:gamma-aminobutyric acid type B receptor
MPYTLPVLLAIATFLVAIADIFAVDMPIIVARYAIEFPTPTTRIRRSTRIDGYVADLVCEPSSFLFTAMLLFWKAIELFVGLYISYLRRNLG